MEHYWLPKEIEYVSPNIEMSIIDLLDLTFKPIVSKNKKDFLIDDPFSDIRKTAYLWEPVYGKEVLFEPIYEVTTIHSCGYYGFFKPSIAEVLAAIVDREDIIKDVRINGFKMSDEPIGIYSCGGGHRAKVLFGHYKEII